MLALVTLILRAGSSESAYSFSLSRTFRNVFQNFTTQDCKPIAPNLLKHPQARKTAVHSLAARPYLSVRGRACSPAEAVLRSNCFGRRSGRRVSDAFAISPLGVGVVVFRPREHSERNMYPPTCSFCARPDDTTTSGCLSGGGYVRVSIGMFIYSARYRNARNNERALRGSSDNVVSQGLA